jgi:proline dehydrogenase
LADEHKIIRRFIFGLVKSHIAGSTLSAALEEARANSSAQVHTTLTFLNNGVDDAAKARYNTTTYMQLVRQASRLQLNADISLRLSQIGFNFDPAVVDKCMNDVLSAAKDSGTNVWIEAEPSIPVETLFKLYRDYRKSYQNLGIEVPVWYPLEVDVIKRYFKPQDMVKLTSYAYPKVHESEEHVQKPEDPKKKRAKKNGKAKVKVKKIKDHEKVAYENYITYAGKLLQAGARVYILDSDEKMVAKIAGFSKEYKKDLIFELPLGYSKKWLKKLAKMKANLSVYTPYGKDWPSYVVNKLTIKHARIRGMAAKVLYSSDGKAMDVDGKDGEDGKTKE